MTHEALKYSTEQPAPQPDVSNARALSGQTVNTNIHIQCYLTINNLSISRLIYKLSHKNVPILIGI